MRFRRHFVAGALTVGCLSGMAMSGVEAGAAEPLVATDCTALLTGASGQQVLMQPAAVLDPVLGALRPLDPLGLLTNSVRQAWLEQAPLPLGTVSSGDLLIPGTAVADATVQRLSTIPLVAPVLVPLTASVSSAVGSTCGVLVQQLRPQAPGAGDRQPPGSTAPGTTPPSSSAPGGSAASTPSGGRLTAQENSGSGATTTFGFADALPFGPTLNFGAPGSLPVPPQGGAAPGAKPADVVSTQRPTGTAEALPVTHDELSQPFLLATLALTLVSAQLVRTWVLRMRRN